MATTGTRLYCGLATLVTAASTIVGQGDRPDAWVLYSKDAASVAVPVWNDATALLRSWSTDRHIEDGQPIANAGAAEIVVRNKTRTIDPQADATIRPGNRWWIRSQFSGITEDLFKGYAETYKMVFPRDRPMDADTVVACVDEIKNLSGPLFDSTDPARDSYRDLVLFDNPAGYWTFDEADGVGHDLPVVGDATVSRAPNSWQIAIVHPAGAIAGQAEPIGSVGLQTDDYLHSDVLEEGQAPDPDGLSEFTVEFWFIRGGNLPTSTEILVQGPLSSATWTWKFSFNTSGQIILEAKNSGGTNHSLTSTSVTANGDPTVGNPAWTHVVGTITGGNLRLYMNGVQEASTAWSGTFGAMDASQRMIIGNNGTTIGVARTRNFDELAFYRHGLAADRVLAHYEGGASRGIYGQSSDTRVSTLLEVIGNDAPRSLRAGTRDVAGLYMVGQTVVAEITNAVLAEADDAFLFVAKDGTVTFLDADHRAVSPWDTVQATFDDDGTDLPYLELDVDYTDEFMRNEWRVTRVGGTLNIERDETSIGTFRERPRIPAPAPLVGDRPGRPHRPEFPVASDGEAADVAAAMLAKYQNPIYRGTLTTDTAVAAVTEAVLALEIGDRIRVLKTHPGGGSRIDQTWFVRGIAISAANDLVPWSVVVLASPL